MSDTHAHLGLSGLQRGQPGGRRPLPGGRPHDLCSSACQPIDVPPAEDRGARLLHLVTPRETHPDSGVLRRPSNVRLLRQAMTGEAFRQPGRSA